MVYGSSQWHEITQGEKIEKYDTCTLGNLYYQNLKQRISKKRKVTSKVSDKSFEKLNI